MFSNMGKILKNHFLKILMVVNLQCMIKVVKVFSYNQNFMLQELSDLAPGLHVHL